MLTSTGTTAASIRPRLGCWIQWLGAMLHYFLEWLLWSCLPWYIGMPTILLGYWYAVSLWCLDHTELCHMSHTPTFITLERGVICWSSLVGLILILVLPASSITCMATTGLLLCQLCYLFLELSYLLCLVSFNLGGHLLCWGASLLLTCTVGIAHFLFLVLPALPPLRPISHSCSMAIFI